VNPGSPLWQLFRMDFSFWAQRYENFHIRNLCMFIISKSVSLCLWVRPYPTRKHKTRLERPHRDKHSCTLRTFVNNIPEKSFMTLGPGARIIKLFASSLTLFTNKLWCLSPASLLSPIQYFQVKLQHNLMKHLLLSTLRVWLGLIANIRQGLLRTNTPADLSGASKNVDFFYRIDTCCEM